MPAPTLPPASNQMPCSEWQLSSPFIMSLLNLQVPVATPGTIGVNVNGVPAACTDPASCTFAYNAAKTPSVTTVLPTNVVFGGATSATLTITGNFTSQATVATVSVKVGVALTASAFGA